MQETSVSLCTLWIKRVPVTEQAAILCDLVSIRERNVTLLENRDNNEVPFPLGQPISAWTIIWANILYTWKYFVVRDFHQFIRKKKIEWVRIHN